MLKNNTILLTFINAKNLEIIKICFIFVSLNKNNK